MSSEDILHNSHHDQVINFSSDSEGDLDNRGGYNSRSDSPNSGLDPTQYLRNPQRQGYDIQIGNELGGGYGNSNNYNEYSPRPNDISASTTPELAQIFSLISKFKPAPLEMTSHFKPFLPELSPAIGSIDAFIKIPRPDGEQDLLGLTVLDEPTIGCSNPQILRMQLREKYGLVTNDLGDGYIGFIEDAVKDTKGLESFLESYEEISRGRAAPSINYTYKMPDYQELMEEWPPELIQCFDSIPLPSSQIDLSLDDYVRVICAILDIPVKGNIIESLHLLFSLYQQFGENLYFNRPKTVPSSLNVRF